MSSAIENAPGASLHPDPPIDPGRLKLLEAQMKRNDYQPDALIEILHTAQKLFGYLSADVLHYVARSLKLPPSRVYGVATFYHFFSLTPGGKHKCVVCVGTGCFTRGAQKVLDQVEQTTGLKAGRTSADGSLSLGTVSCLGACGIGPAVVYDNDVEGFQTPDLVDEHMKSWGI